MNDMRSLEAHLTALHDELLAAAKTEDDEARKKIDEALRHLEAAQEQLRATTGARAEQIGAHLDALQAHAVSAKSERGESLRARIAHMIAACKNAIGQCIEEQTMTP